MALAPGTRLGVYEILSLIGAGGMGEVYRAIDSRLDRHVALKVLPDAFATDPERTARFQREAKVLASLNHPHIAGLFGLEQDGNRHFLTMELVEGETLADRIARGPIPLDEALPIAKQIAEALEGAHEQGIIHRDLKPANVKVRPDGTVKVLDFGLAKSLCNDSAVASAPLTNSPTIASPVGMTGIGVLLGTAAYMAPEQAKGKATDKRADVWAFGCVLYEMLTGRRCFRGEDVSDTLAAVLGGAPDFTALPSETPPSIQRLLRRSLEREVRSRSDMAMVRAELRDAQLEQSEQSEQSKSNQSVIPHRVLVGLTSVALLAAVVLAIILAMRGRDGASETSQTPTRFSLNLPSAGQLSSQRNPVAISSDGSRIAFATNERLYVRALEQLNPLPITGTELGGATGSARLPFFSPDGGWIAFWQQNQLRKVPVSGGAAAVICDTVEVPAGANWGSEGEILWGTLSRGIFRVSANGGTPAQIISVSNDERATNPERLPGTEWVLFVLFGNASPDQGQVVVQSTRTGERRILVDGARDARYLRSGHLLFARGTTLLAQPFDVEKMTVRGMPVAVVEGVAGTGGGQDYSLRFAVAAATGTLVYVAGSGSSPIALTRLVHVSRNGTIATLAEIPGMAWFPRYSPDGSKVAYGVSTGTDLNDPSDLWVVDAKRGARTRVTFNGNNRFYPIWTRDGTHLTFADGTGPTNQLLSTPADGSGTAQVLLERGTRRYPSSWSPDGRTLAFYMGGITNTRDLWMLRFEDGKPKTMAFVETPFEERGAIFSPDGQWLAYVSNKSGQNDVYARPFPGPGEEITISVGGGREPVWSPAGDQLFYRQNGKLYFVPVKSSGGSLTVGAPKPLWDDPYRLDTGGAGGGMANYDISPDGKQFVMVELPRSTAEPPAVPAKIDVVLNWFEELKRLVPTD